jgi:phage I-like protein
MDRLELATCDRALPPAGTVPDWVHLLPPGRIVGRDSRTFDLVDPSGLVLSFQSGGIDLPVDYEHQNDKPEAKLKGPVPAAGWIKELRSDETGIWGRVEWTATARELIERKEYRYLSPVILHNKAGQIMRLKGAGLVHNPNLFLTALASQEDPMKPTLPAKTDKPGAADLADPAAFTAAIAELIGLPPETPPNELLAKLKARMTAEPDPAKFMPMEAVQSMLAARGIERTALAESQVAAKVDRAVREGYVTPAMRGWAVALCRSDEAAFDNFLETAGPAWGYLLKETHTKGTPPGVSTSPVPQSDVERAIYEQLGLKPGTLAT